jgi:hypothetical protein
LYAHMNNKSKKKKKHKKEKEVKMKEYWSKFFNSKQEGIISLLVESW